MFRRYVYSNDNKLIKLSDTTCYQNIKEQRIFCRNFSNQFEQLVRIVSNNIYNFNRYFRDKKVSLTIYGKKRSEINVKWNMEI